MAIDFLPINPPGLVVILGATATGKTQLAIVLAQAWGLPILNADSRQVYRQFDIGTAKPTLEERQGVPHYLIDIADPDRTVTLATYQREAQGLIEGFHGQGITPILVGGTGLYIKAITHGMGIPAVAPYPCLRQQLDHLGQDYCYGMLTTVDPLRARQIHHHDRFRTIRALEIYYVTGQRPSALQQNHPPSYPIRQIGILPPDPASFKRIITHRIQTMLDRGWLKEIEALQQAYGTNLPLLQTLGYQEMADYLLGKVSLESAIDATVRSTLQLAKQQRTWFRSPENVLPHLHWVPFETPMKDLLDLLHNLKDG